MLPPELLHQRSRLLQAVRSFFLAKQYIEVDTPVRLPVLIPESHIHPFQSDGWYLQTSPEICMKRLLATGSPNLFQLSRCFRKEEIGRLHLSEFVLLEWYHAGWSYYELMDECEELILSLVNSGQNYPAIRDQFLQCGGRTISFIPPWDRFTVDHVFRKFAGVSALEAVNNDTFDELLVSQIEPHLGWKKPAFLFDYPVDKGSLARRKVGQESMAERFELYVAGIELVNGFSELIDPAEQRQRFTMEIEGIRQTGRHAAMPEKFLHDLDRMQETAGAALGFDRLCMLLLGLEAVAEAVCLNDEDL